MAVDHVVPERRTPRQDNAVRDSRRSARITGSSQSFRHAEDLAGMNQAHDDLLAVRRHLNDLQPSLEKKEEPASGIPLPEDRPSPLNPEYPRRTDNLLQLRAGHFPEQVKPADRCAVHLLACAIMSVW